VCNALTEILGDPAKRSQETQHCPHQDTRYRRQHGDDGDWAFRVTCLAQRALDALRQIGRGYEFVKDTRRCRRQVRLGFLEEVIDAVAHTV